MSLLNEDLKVLSFVLEQGLKKILSKSINEDRTGYIKTDLLVLISDRLKTLLIIRTHILFRGQ